MINLLSEARGVTLTIGIYCIEHVNSGKRYIGKSINIEKRLTTHKYLLQKEEQDFKQVNRHLWAAVQKYGWESFDNYILQEFSLIDEEAISIAELMWIDYFNTTNRKKGYNLRRDSSTKMIVHDETKLLQSENTQGENNPNFGNYWTKEQKDRMSKIAINRHDKGLYGNDWRRKISESSIKLWKDDVKRKQMAKKVSKKKEKYKFHQYDKKMNLIRTWDTVKDIISENPEYKWQNIYSVCNGYKKTYMGYIWVKEIKI